MIPKIYLLLFVTSLLFTSCVNTQKITYFNDLAKANGAETASRLQALKVQPGDILQITITTIDKDISLILNPAAVGASPLPAESMDPGYIVDSSGNINLPMIGTVYVKGKTTTEINNLITQELSKTIRNPFVSTRIANFRVSVLGDVARPGSYRISGERASVLDALSMAGDLNVTALRNDIMIIREENGEKTYASLNLNNGKTLASPYYYLHNNDVIYVKPGPNKQFNTSKIVQLLPAAIGILSLITTIIIVSVK